MGSDGAAVMTGRSEGTTRYMLRRNPHLINSHCLAHREALCTSQAAKKVLQDYQETLTSLFLYTKHSPNKRSKLEDYQKVLDDPQLKYKEVYEVRWLSFFTALETVFKTIDSLLFYLNQVKLNDPKGIGLRKKIATEKFLYITHMMMDIMPPLMKLRLWFQKDNLDVALIHINVDHCINELLNLQNEQGEHMKLLKNDLHDEMGKRFFKGHEISKCGQQLVSCRKDIYRANYFKHEKKISGDRIAVFIWCT